MKFIFMVLRLGSLLSFWKRFSSQANEIQIAWKRETRHFRRLSICIGYYLESESCPTNRFRFLHKNNLWQTYRFVLRKGQYLAARRIFGIWERNKPWYFIIDDYRWTDQSLDNRWSGIWEGVGRSCFTSSAYGRWNSDCEMSAAIGLACKPSIRSGTMKWCSK